MTAHTTDRLRRSAWVLAAGALLLAVAAVAGHLRWGLVGDVSWGPVVLATFAAAGGVILQRQPRHRIGWLLLAVGLSNAAAAASGVYARYDLVVRDGALPAGEVAGWLAGWLWIPGVALLTSFLPLLFPDGRPPSPGWRWLGWAAGAAAALATVGTAVEAWPRRGVALADAAPQPGAVWPLGMALTGLTALAALVALGVRLRRSRGEERHQIKWLVTALALSTLAIVPLTLAAGADRPPDVALLSLLTVAVAAGIAVLRYRLSEIDVVIHRAVVVGMLAAFVTVVYVAIVVGVGALAGSAADDPHAALSILATAVVAVAFQPARERIQRLADRLVHGERATPYQVMAEFAGHLADAYSVEEVLPRMAAAAAAGVGAERARVTARLPGGRERSATWPPGRATNPAQRPAGEVADPSAGAAQQADPATSASDEVADPDGWDRSIQVSHQGATVGGIAVRMPAGSRLSPGRERLLLDLAAQAGVALRHVALTSELQDRLQELSTQTEQLHASRQRLVAAQDQARRRMEREIHDGAQQHLVAMSMKLGLVGQLLDRDPGRAVALLDQLGGDANAALEGLRDLARGIYPPLLTDRGVLATLDAHVRKHGIAATIVAAPEFMAGRFPQPAEVAVYFCVLEALQNASQHAPGAQMTIRLGVIDGDLEFSVEDDGPGFDPSTARGGTGLQHMVDRVEALGGSLTVESAPGRGTVVRGRIPGTVAAPVPR